MTSNELEIFKQSIIDDVRVMMQTTGQVTQYIGARYVPLISDPIDWSDQKEYEPLTIVTYQGNSYTSRQFVPKGTPITNTQFWASTGNFNAQIEQYRIEVTKLQENVNTNTSAISALTANKADKTTVEALESSKINKADSISMKALGFSETNADENDSLLASMRGTVKQLNVDGDFPFSNPITINGDFIMSGSGSLIYEGPDTTGFFITIDETQTVDSKIKLRMHRIELHIDCKNNIDGILNKCGVYNIYELFVEKPKSLGVEYTSGNGYDNYSTIFVNATNQNVVGVFINKNDERFASITTHDCMTGVKINGSSLFINTISGWCYSSKYFNGSKQLHVVYSQSLYITNLNCDTFETATYFDNLEHCEIENFKIITNSDDITPGTTLWEIKKAQYSPKLHIANLNADKYNYAYMPRPNDIRVTVDNSNLQLVGGDILECIMGRFSIYYETSASSKFTNLPTSQIIDKTTLIVKRYTEDMTIITPISRWNTSNYILISEKTSATALRWGKLQLTY